MHLCVFVSIFHVNSQQQIKLWPANMAQGLTSVTPHDSMFWVLGIKCPYHSVKNVQITFGLQRLY